MQVYEIMTITGGKSGESKAQEVLESLKNLISTNKGNLIESNFWGKRKLAYLINNEEEGYYNVMKFELEGDKLDKLKAKLNLLDGLVRYLIVSA